MNNARTIETYQANTKLYAEKTPIIVTGHVKAWIDEALCTLPPDAKIFELGSATGRDAAYIKSCGFSLLCSDATPKFTEELLHKNIEAIPFNALTDAFPDHFDLIFANAVLLHFNRDECEKVLRKIFGSLNKSGCFAFSLKQGDAEIIENEKLNAPRFFCYWQPEAIENLLTQIGFTASVKVVADTKSSTSWLHIIAYK